MSSRAHSSSCSTRLRCVSLYDDDNYRSRITFKKSIRFSLGVRSERVSVPLLVWSLCLSRHKNEANENKTRKIKFEETQENEISGEFNFSFERRFFADTTLARPKIKRQLSLKRSEKMKTKQWKWSDTTTILEEILFSFSYFRVARFLLLVNVSFFHRHTQSTSMPLI